LPQEKHREPAVSDKCKPGRPIILGIFIFGAIEILIGTTTFIAVTLSLFRGASAKPAEVLVFVLVTACISTGLGIGILSRRLSALRLLLFFSCVIILSKALIFAKIITLNGALETAFPSSVKNIISVVYHALVVVYFTSKPVRSCFGERRKGVI